MGEELRCGWIGLGAMGLPMAARAAAEGVPTAAYARRHEVRTQAGRLGIRECGSVAELARESDVIMLAVVDDGQVLEVATGVDGVLANVRAGSTIVIISTVRPATAAQLGDLAREVQAQVLDAPVSGGSIRAESGELTMMVGGERDVLERCRAVLRPLAALIEHVGPLGAGSAVKLANNMMSNANQLVALEAVRLAESYGIGEETLIAIARTGTGDSWPVREWGYFDRILTDRPDSRSPAVYHYLTKDLRGAVDAGAAAGISLDLCARAADLAEGIYRRRLRVLDERATPVEGRD